MRLYQMIERKKGALWLQEGGGIGAGASLTGGGLPFQVANSQSKIVFDKAVNTRLTDRKA